MTRGPVLITGGSTGFGRLAALEAARHGSHVLATMRDPSRGVDLLEQTARASLDLEVHALDTTDHAQIETLTASIHERLGPRVGLVNNAGYGCGGFVEELSDAELRAQFDTVLR